MEADSTNSVSIINNASPTLTGADTLCVDYSKILVASGIDFMKGYPYLLVGEIPASCKWILIIAIVKSQIVELLEILIPFLQRNNLAFAIPTDSDAHTLLLDGSFGANQIGKTILIYPDCHVYVEETALDIIELTGSYSGPEVICAERLEGVVYAQPADPSSSPSWPFHNIRKPGSKPELKKLNNYLLVERIKADAKGHVYKAVFHKKWFKIGWAIIKEGKANQCADRYGRTIKDRLQWQFELSKRLKESVSLPAAIDLIAYDGNSYLVTEFINGVLLNDQLIRLQAGNVWFALNKDAKRQLLKYLLKIVDQIEVLHSNGIIHRDINPGNFIITETDEVALIDLELAYDSISNYPAPAFTFGTAGYISPQQQGLKVPEVTDDIYAFGALSIKVLTGISPGKFEIGQRLFYQLNYFIDNTGFCNMLVKCLNAEKSQRPTLKSIRHTLEVYDAMILTCNHDNSNPRVEAPVSETMHSYVQSAINSLGACIMQGENQLWKFRDEGSEGELNNELKVFAFKSGFANGCAGVLYTLALAERCGYILCGLENAIYNNTERMLGFGHNDIVSGLYYGSNGYGIALQELISTGLYENSIQNANLLYSLNKLEISGLNIANGLAGKGLTILKISDKPNFPSLYQDLTAIAGALADAQLRDGSWLVKRNESEKRGVKLNGFFHGIAGIIFFLIQYIARFEDSKAKSAVMKGLDYLLEAKRENDGITSWQISEINKSADPWLEHGFSGVALTFIYAYEYLRDENYRLAAESVLAQHPRYLSSNYLTFANGVAGLGEIYLEAHRVFKNEEWQDRASHIANLLINVSRSAPDGSIYWLEGNATLPTPSFMHGNTGIIHFLMRYNSNSKIKFPLN